MRTRTARVAATAMAISGLFAACGQNGDASFPVGVYVHPGSTETTGSIEFKSDGSRIELGSNNNVVTQGTYSIDGDQLTWETDSFCKTVSDTAESATYTWTADGDLLTMTVEGEDLCTVRARVIQPGFEKADS